MRFKDQRILISTNNSNFENIDSNINSLVDIEINDFDITFKLNERKICFYLISIPDKDCRTYLTNNIFDYLSDVKNKGVIV